MLTRSDVLTRAANECMKELYSLAQPSISWKEFVKENKIYSNKYKAWERFIHLYKEEPLTESELKEYSTFPIKNWEGKNKYECIGPAPYEFYYLPRKIFDEIVESYVYAYKMDDRQNLLDIIKILKDYCDNPIIDKYVNAYTDEHGNYHTGHKDFDHPDNLEKEIYKIIDDEDISQLIKNKFFNFLDMAGNFFNWNRDVNSFKTTIYLGASPNSDKQTVIDNWKTYRKQTIEIDDSKYDDYNE